MSIVQRLESLFERALWQARLVVLLAVIATIVSSLVLFFMATWDVVELTWHALGYVSPSLVGEAQADLRRETVAHVVEVVDGYLLATFLLIFGFGLYELFISDIDAAKGERAASKILVIESLDDLKSRLAKVILMILIVRLFEQILTIEQPRPIDLLYVGGCLVAIGLALWLAHHAEHRAE